MNDYSEFENAKLEGKEIEYNSKYNYPNVGGWQPMEENQIFSAPIEYYRIKEEQENRKLYINLYSGCYLTDDELIHIMKGYGSYTSIFSEEQGGYVLQFGVDKACENCEHFKYDSKCELFNFSNVSKSESCSRWGNK